LKFVTDELIVRAKNGRDFEDAPDNGRIIISGTETGGAYSIMEINVTPRPMSSEAGSMRFGPHRHAAIEEVFIVRHGSIEFLLGDVVSTLHPNDVVRVTAGTRHGYCNRSSSEVTMLVVFSPGGFEELFAKYRSDQSESSGDGFVADAERHFATTFESDAS
jgi:mannose-6-phosphate isomerase-like protein (cupin superfamily)